MSESRKFLKHFMVIGGGTLISMLIGFITTPIITRIVSPVEYGKYSIFTMYSNIALLILCLGLDQAFVRYFYDDESSEYKHALLYKCVMIPFVATGVVSIIAFFLCYKGYFKFELGLLSLVLLCVYTIIQSIYRFSSLLIRLRYKSKTFSMLGIVQKALYVIVALALIYSGLFSNTVSLQISITVASFLVLIISILKELTIWKPTGKKYGEKMVTFRELIQYSLPFVFSMGITSIFQYVDQISLKIFCSYHDVGIYSSTMTLVHIFAIIQTTFNTLWAPMSVEHYTKNKTDVLFYQKWNQIITVIMFFMGFSLILVKDLFSILLGSKYREAAYILPFLIFNPIMYTISETTVVGIVVKKKSIMQIVVSLGACITNVVGNLLLVPKLGCKGAAISTGIAYIVFWLLRTIISNRYYYINFELRKFLIITSVTIMYAFYNTFVNFNILSIFQYFICIAVLVILYKETIAYLINKTIEIIQNKILHKN